MDARSLVASPSRVILVEGFLPYGGYDGDDARAPKTGSCCFALILALKSEFEVLSH